ncbi:MAG TPA: nickel-binding protein [Thermodesulfobacteriota bacterium]
MPRFLTVRTVPPLTEEQMITSSKRSMAIGEEIGVKWIKSYHSAKDGKLYCEWEAPSVEAIYEHARLMNSAIDSVSVISDEFDPSMFK